MSKPRALGTAAILLGVLAGLAGPAVAHPHIFIDAGLTITFGADRELASITHAWRFDEAFSAWQVQGLDADGDGSTSSAEMQELADENLIGLEEYQFYTSAGAGPDSLRFTASGEAKFEFENGRSTLSFSIEPQPSYRIGERFEISVADPEYYVAIDLARSDITVENAPEGCTTSLRPARDMPEEIAARLSALPPEVTSLPPDLAAALRGVHAAIIIECPPAAGGPVAELAASKPVGTNSPSPFGGLPPEPQPAPPGSGVLGWVAEVQSGFYQSLTAALGQLKVDFAAFWVLGGLSFLYGIFHAAGPGHGKVVIASYMLANEQQLRRGVALSFAASLLQSGVAVAFVGIAAVLLRMTSIAMGEAATWIGLVSYGMVALLGLWLVLRKLFGRGHSHAHHDEPSGDMLGKARRHLHAEAEPEHHHVPHMVLPAQLGGDWREQLGVILAIGARPCSGALVVLVFALSQGVLPAGIAAVLLMGLGTGITVSVLAVLAVSAKGLAGRLLGADGRMSMLVLWWAELAGAMAVLAFGTLLLFGSL